ncbi:MAG: hypothetical protein RI983_1469 [Bacteroidota bacterium]
MGIRLIMVNRLYLYSVTLFSFYEKVFNHHFVFSLAKLNWTIVQKRNWVDYNIDFTASNRKKTTITNSLPHRGGVVNYKGKEYNYFIFWTNISNK